jgi:2,4-didehydro-3-deoxy-L-rhamnonate hydrolase
VRISIFNDNRLGIVNSDRIHDVTSVLDALPARRYPLPRHDLLIEALPELRARLEQVARETPGIPLSEARLLSPIANPGKIVAAPVNYRKHLEEAIAEPETFSAAHVRRIQETGLFLKATSSLIGPSQAVRIRQSERRTDHEVELAVVIGRVCDRVAPFDALSYVAGYTIGLDITVRGPEERSMRKSIDTYTVLGPWIVTADEIGDPANLELAINVNDEPRQRANTRDLILGIPELIAFASSYYTLFPGDILLTGTPEGVGPIRAGDNMHADIERIGSMSVSVAD